MPFICIRSEIKQVRLEQIGSAGASVSTSPWVASQQMANFPHRLYPKAPNKSSFTFRVFVIIQ